MRRRLVAAMVGMVVLTLLLGGLATLLVNGARARRQAESTVRTNVVDVAASVEELLAIDPQLGEEDQATQLRRRLTLLRAVGNVLDLDELTVATIDQQNRITSEQAIPQALLDDDVDVTRLGIGALISGHRDGQAYAATVVQLRPGLRLAVVAERDVNAGLRPALGLLAIVAAGTLVAGALLAWALASRLARPVQLAAQAAVAMAGGRLDTRLPQPRPTDTDEVAELTRSVNYMAASLERSRMLEQQFLLSISHDLRTPLTSIRGYAEAITDGHGQPAASAEIIRREALRLDRLVADLLDLARARSTAFSLHPIEVDVEAAARAAVSSATPRANELGVSIRVAAAATGGATVRVDNDRLAQAIGNLLDNALRFAVATIEVTVARNANTAVLVVDDDGPGIAPADLPFVFERLYRAPQQPTRTENSSGIGLALVRELAQVMGGTVEAGRSPLGGARFTLRLPLAAAPTERR